MVDVKKNMHVELSVLINRSEISLVVALLFDQDMNIFRFLLSLQKPVYSL